MLSIIIPVIELSSNPIRFDHYNLLRQSVLAPGEIEKVKAILEAKPQKQEAEIETGRKRFYPNPDRIELDITYDCNLKCFHCNRSCSQAPSTVHMTPDQIQIFIKESIDLNKKWELINIIGGEPTLHPNFAEIIESLLNDYIVPHSPATIMQITSNGYGDLVKSKLQALPRSENIVINTNSFKNGREIPYFTPFNLAPIDQSDGQDQEYYKGCWVTSYCGIGLNHLGYFACGVAGGIERLLKAGLGIQSLLNSTKPLVEQLDTYCRLCGNFTTYAVNRGDFMERAEKDVPPVSAISETWKNLYQQHENEKS
jgi:hypothetical protein